MKSTFAAFFALTLFTIPAFAAESGNVEKDMVNTMATYCAAAARTAHGDAAALASQNSLPEFPQEQAKTFLNGGGRVFTLPNHFGKVLLVLRDDGSCGVAGSSFNAKTLWAELDNWVAANPEFKKLSANNTGGDQKRQYTADTEGGSLSLFVMARGVPVKGQLQGLMTVSRKAGK